MPTTIAAPKERPAAEKDFLPLQGTDYIGVLCRQRQAGRAFLQDRLWLPKLGLFRS